MKIWIQKNKKLADWDDGHNRNTEYREEFNKLAKIKDYLKKNNLGEALEAAISIDKVKLASNLIPKIKTPSDLINAAFTAIEKGRLQTLELLFKQGLDHKAQKNNILTYGKKYFKEHTLLTKAVETGQLDIVKYLTKIQKVDITAEITYKNKRTITAIDIRGVFRDEEGTDRETYKMITDKEIYKFLKPLYERKRKARTRPLLKLIDNLPDHTP